MSDVQGLKSDIWCPVCYVRCLMSDVRCLMSNVRCQMSVSDVWYPLFDLWCPMSNVWCLMPDVRGPPRPYREFQVLLWWLENQGPTAGVCLGVVSVRNGSRSRGLGGQVPMHQPFCVKVYFKEGLIMRGRIPKDPYRRMSIPSNTVEYGISTV